MLRVKLVIGRSPSWIWLLTALNHKS